MALATFIKTNQNPNSERWRFAPPLTIWVLCPNKNGDSYNIERSLKVLLRGTFKLLSGFSFSSERYYLNSASSKQLNSRAKSIETRA